MKFVNQLTDKEILVLIPFYHVYDYEECSSPIPETRLFKMQPTYGGPYQDVVIGDTFEVGTVRYYGVTEAKFMEFMLNRFGEQYAYWYQGNERQKANQEILQYADKRNRACNEKIRRCFAMLSNLKDSHE